MTPLAPLLQSTVLYCTVVGHGWLAVRDYDLRGRSGFILPHLALPCLALSHPASSGLADRCRVRTVFVMRLTSTVLYIEDKGCLQAGRQAGIYWTVSCSRDYCPTALWLASAAAKGAALASRLLYPRNVVADLFFIISIANASLPTFTYQAVTIAIL